MKGVEKGLANRKHSVNVNSTVSLNRLFWLNGPRRQHFSSLTVPMKPLSSHVCPSEEVPGKPHHISRDKKGRPRMDSCVRFWWPLGTADGQTGHLFSWAESRAVLTVLTDPSQNLPLEIHLSSHASALAGCFRTPHRYPGLWFSVSLLSPGRPCRGGLLHNPI